MPSSKPLGDDWQSDALQTTVLSQRHFPPLTNDEKRTYQKWKRATFNRIRVGRDHARDAVDRNWSDRPVTDERNELESCSINSIKSATLNRRQFCDA
jgi:hypothetical protein